MTLRALLAVADGVEDIETVTIVDVLRRAEIDLVVASIEERRRITCARGSCLTADVLFADVLEQSFDLLILPGGQAGAERLAAHEPLARRMRQQADQGKAFAAICAAPALALQAYGVLQQRRVTCYPALREHLSGCEYVDQPVVVDGNCITSQGPATAMAFALSLVEQSLGQDKRNEIAKALLMPES